MSKPSFERKKTSKGKSNPKYVDVLEQDPEIKGQSWTLFSFISPERVLKQKNIYMFSKFVKQWEMRKSMDKFSQFLQFVSYKYKLKFEEIGKDFEDFIEEERHELAKYDNLYDDWMTFLDKEEEKLTEAFNKENPFQTSVRGVKSRGNFATKEEALEYGENLRKLDPAFDILAGETGTWMAFDQEAYKSGQVEYMEEELNQLVHEKMKNEAAAKEAFELRKREAKERAIRENMSNARKTGATVTQVIDDEGELLNLAETNTQVSALIGAQKEGEEVSVEAIRAQLFEGDAVTKTSGASFAAEAQRERGVADNKGSDHGTAKLSPIPETNENVEG